MNKEIVQYRSDEKYNYLVEDCIAIITQRIKNSRQQLIIAYAEIGERIVSDKFYNKFGKGNQEFLKGLFLDIGICSSNGYAAIALYEKYFLNRFQDVSTGMEILMSEEFLPEGDNLSWNKIKTKYLVESQRQEDRLADQENCSHQHLKCLRCGKIIDVSQIKCLKCGAGSIVENE